jgi:two-component system C4-dicarboxylate transport sensor histidine kinase DctB
MLTLYARKFGDVGAEVLAPPEEHGLRLTTYESDVRIALHEVLCNAADALKESRIPVPERRVELKIATDGGRAIISITDNGGGFSDEALAHMFEPHFSTRKDGRHQGIGLYVAKHMVQAVGGSIDARNSSKGGAEVLLTIPDLSKR